MGIGTPPQKKEFKIKLLAGKKRALDRVKEKQPPPKKKKKEIALTSKKSGSGGDMSRCGQPAAPAFTGVHKVRAVAIYP